MNSKPSYIDIEHVAGGEKDYQERFLETKKLGEGEFGEVKLVHDVKATANDMTTAKYLAVKYLRKGFTFKDNTLFPPLKKEMLQGEVEILRRLNGEVREGEAIIGPYRSCGRGLPQLLVNLFSMPCSCVPYLHQLTHSCSFIYRTSFHISVLQS